MGKAHDGPLAVPAALPLEATSLERVIPSGRANPRSIVRRATPGKRAPWTHRLGGGRPGSRTPLSSRPSGSTSWPVA